MKEKEFTELLKNIEDGSYSKEELTIVIDPFNNTRDGDRLRDAQAVLLANALKKNPTITKVDLACNYIGDVGAAALASVPSIKELSLEQNNVGPIGVIALAASSLESLNLGANISRDNFSLVECQNVVKAMIDNHTIKTLDLSYCYLPSGMVAELIGKNTTITTLNLGDDLTDVAFIFIKDNITLKILSIPENNLTDVGANYLSKNTSLTELMIGNSNIGYAGAFSLTSHHTLKRLSLHDSNLTYGEAQVFIGSNLNEIILSTNLKQRTMSWEECKKIELLFSKAKNPDLYLEYERPEKKMKTSSEDITPPDDSLTTDLLGSLEQPGDDTVI